MATRVQRTHGRMISLMNKVVRSKGTDLDSIAQLNSSEARPKALICELKGWEYMTEMVFYKRGTQEQKDFFHLYDNAIGNYADVMNESDARIFETAKSFQNSKQYSRGMLQALASGNTTKASRMRSSLISQFKNILLDLDLLEK